MRYFYFNAKRSRWSEISELSYNIKKRSPLFEMQEGDKVAAIQPSKVKPNRKATQARRKPPTPASV